MTRYFRTSLTIGRLPPQSDLEELDYAPRVNTGLLEGSLLNAGMDNWFSIDGHQCQVVSIDELVPCLEAAPGSARMRERYLPNEVAHFTLAGHRYAVVAAALTESAASDSPVKPDIHSVLTNRELQIVQLICMGMLTKQVSDRLRISEFTVRSYLKTIYCKLGVRSRGAMVYAYAQSFTRIAPDRWDPVLSGRR
jgi:DNA-binding CsgD family transcriptional regulator